MLDSPAMRWRDTDDNGELDEELYYLQDFRGDVTGLALDHKHGVVERVRYGLTGRPEVFPPADVDFDGDVDTDDADAFDKALNAFIDDPADYDPRADLDHDGVIDGEDETLFLESHGLNNGLEGNWKLSQGAGTYKTDQPADGLDNRFGWRGYWYDPKLELYHVRHRVFDPRSGRWMQVDPLGFAAGDQDLYRYCNGEYSMGYDPLGLEDDGPPGQHGFWFYVFHFWRSDGDERVVDAQPAANGNDVANIRSNKQYSRNPEAVRAQMERAANTGNHEALSAAIDRKRATFDTELQGPLRLAMVYAGGVVVVVTVTTAGLDDLAFYAALKGTGIVVRGLSRVGGKWFAELSNGKKIEVVGEDAAKLDRLTEKEAAAATRKTACEGEKFSATYDSKTLGENLGIAGFTREADQAAHHIIGNNRAAESLRERMSSAGIEINSSLNGVFLDRAFHETLNNAAYRQGIIDKFNGAATRADFERLLNEVRGDLLQQQEHFRQLSR